MKLGSTVGLFSEFGENRYKKMKEYGFDYADVPIDPESLRQTKEECFEYARHEKALADEAGVTIWQIHGPWRWPPHDETEEIRAKRAEFMKLSIDATAMIGAKYWVIHPMMPYGDNDTYPDFDVEEFYKVNRDFFKNIIIPYAKERGIVICFENMPMKGMHISSPERTLEFVRDINDENFKLCLDTGHAAVLKSSPAEAVRLAGADLKTLHVHDNSGNRDEHLLPLNGIIDWADFKAALTEIGFDGVFSLETGWGSFIKNGSFQTRIKALKAILDEIVPN